MWELGEQLGSLGWNCRWRRRELSCLVSITSWTGPVSIFWALSLAGGKTGNGAPSEAMDVARGHEPRSGSSSKGAESSVGIS